MQNRTTRVSKNGNSPAEFRLDTDRVQMSCSESGDLILHPLRPERGQALLHALEPLGHVDQSFIDTMQAERAEQLPVQEREGL